ncbi:MAG TPA: fumarylacetoacetate hydrolase family protein [Jatrophihabitantaceae bacterium]|jgi:2-keto-4-pentenoate hydratase/2-oxohepta-3-ene-1,7-dioic acid hydratase in catechol pathway|nr:fumarylacetoacetate hydrolase family protein [Jatrophihabitantaceae bacterium]
MADAPRGARWVALANVRIARFVHPGSASAPSGVLWGTVEGPADALPDALTVAAIDGHPFGPITFTGDRWALPDVRLLSPILPSKVVALGRNYADHAKEMGGEAPTTPMIFLKPSTSVIGEGDTIRLPPSSDEVHFEGELAVIIGRPARNVGREDALSYILGYAAANDVTARDQQRADVQFTRAKGYDSFCPLGPWFETVLDPSDLRLTTRVNGEIKQDGRTSQMIHDLATQLAFISGVMTLLPGDVVLTGTPAGVGPIVDGDTVSVEIEGIGTLTNLVKKS